MTAITARAPRALPARRTAFGKIVLNEARLNLRQPQGLIGGLAIPIVLLFVFGNLSAFKQVLPGFGGRTIFDVYVPTLIAFGLGMLALLGLPIQLTSSPRAGRAAPPVDHPGTPVLGAGRAGRRPGAASRWPPTIVIVLVSHDRFRGGSPGQRGRAPSCRSLLGITGLAAIGLLISALSKTATGASVIGRVAFFPLMFFAGLWLPRPRCRTLLFDISNYTPLGGRAGDPGLDADRLPAAAPLLVLAAYAAVLATWPAASSSGSKSRSVGYAIDPERDLSPTPATPLGDVDGVGDRSLEPVDGIADRSAGGALAVITARSDASRGWERPAAWRWRRPARRPGPVRPGRGRAGRPGRGRSPQG